MRELNTKAINGDRDAINTVLINMKDEMYKIAKSRLNSEDDIQDAIQDTIVSILHNIKKVRKPEYLKTWIIRILINKCNDIYKKNKKERELQEKVINDFNDNNYLEKSESSINLENILASLKYKERLTLSLYYASDFSIREISRILKEPQNTIKTRIKRSKEKIRKIIGDKYE